MEMVYDPADGYVLAFSGQFLVSGNWVESDQTWAYQAGNWTDITPKLSISPPGRIFAGLAYDAAHSSAVLFGGAAFLRSNQSREHYFNDTWTFSGGKWAKVNTSTTPFHRYGLQMTYDAADGYLVLFGGNFQTLTTVHVYSDTWTFVNGTWSRLTPVESPTARYVGAAAYDNASRKVILFGGQNVQSGSLRGTWSYQGGAWTQLNVSGPSARWGDSMTYDNSLGAVLLFGGFSGSTGYVNDTWEFTG
jgi:hypothetical protein